MAHKASDFPLGKSNKFDVALQRPTVNLKESENVASQAAAVLRKNDPTVRFAKHGTFFGPAKPNPLEQE